jgi:hypothetical protein
MITWYMNHILVVGIIRQFVLFGTLLLLLSGILVNTVVTAQSDAQVALKQDIDVNWYLSEEFSIADYESPAGNNVSFTVTVHSIEFTFMYYLDDLGVLDDPAIVVVQVHFEDNTKEILEPTVGGFVGWEFRLALTSHKEPQAAIVSAYGYEHEEWYGWYYAVDPNSTSPTSPMNLELIQIGMYITATFAGIIVLTLIIINHKKSKS